jgi:hypothetical protein
MNKDELIAHMTAESAPGTPMMSTRSRRCSPTTLCIPTTPLRERLPGATSNTATSTTERRSTRAISASQEAAQSPYAARQRRPDLGDQPIRLVQVSARSGSQSRAEEVRCRTHHNEKRRWSRPGCSRRARRCRARRGSRRQPSGGHRLVALRLDLDRKHRAQLGNAREQVRIEVQRGIVAGGDDLPQLPLRATVSIRLRATEIRRCQAPWRRPPQSP